MGVLDVASWVVLIAALLTWYGFASRMRRAFRYAQCWTPAKTLLVFSGWASTWIQLGALSWYGPLTLGHALLALVLYASAYALFRAALRAHGATKPAFVFTQVAPSSFCTAGPYRYIRHPLYTAYILAWLIPPLATAQLWVVIPTIWMTFLYTIAAWREERAFAWTPYAALYQRYRQQAGMFWPRPRTLLADLVARWRAEVPAHDRLTDEPRFPESPATSPREQVHLAPGVHQERTAA
ncbi:MAG: isoprenylcysteine carboxylmethyltransferase family protein [Gemmatales bacterium]|nr:isoprenylcysteine carboxylmethyltransferase family protein [Gemmatales bacterium]MDW7993024.1 isoprenylcysteine carboxylmethyltransferase family protein [Gemmatales bacterium]